MAETKTSTHEVAEKTVNEGGRTETTRTEQTNDEPARTEKTVEQGGQAKQIKPDGR
jgi:hypothetical protein